MSATAQNVSKKAKKKNKKKNSATTSTIAASVASATSSATSSTVKITAAAKKEAEQEYQKGLALLKTANQTNSAALYATASAIGVANPLTKAHDHFLKAIKLNPDHLAALLRLGESYYLGRGVKKNDTLAFGFYTKAARFRNDTAYFMLGQFYLKGIGRTEDLDMALYHFNAMSLKAQDDPNVQYNLATLYYSKMQKNNQNIAENKKNKQLYIEHATKGADLGEHSCIVSLAQYYISEEPSLELKNKGGYYVKKGLKKCPELSQDPIFRLVYAMCLLYGYGYDVNLQEAKTHILSILNQTDLSKATHENAQFHYAYILINDNYASLSEKMKHHSKAIEILEKLATANNKKARANLMYYSIEPEENNLALPQNLTLAKKWALIATNEQDPEGYYYLARVQLSENDPKKSFENFNTAWNLGNVMALPELAKCYLYGQGIAKNLPKAERLLLQYKKLDEKKACFLLADLYYTSNNLAQTIRHLELAAGLKVWLANYILGLMHFNGIYVKRDLKKGLNYLSFSYADRPNNPKIEGMYITFILFTMLTQRSLEINTGFKFQKIAEMFGKSLEKLPNKKIQGLILKRTNQKHTNDYDHEFVFETFDCLVKILSLEVDSDFLIFEAGAFTREIFKNLDSITFAAALCGLARCYLLGEGVTADIEMGRKYLRQAAELGNNEAQYLFARECESGNEQDRILSLKYLNLAAPFHKQARDYLNWKAQLKKNNDLHFVEISTFPHKFDQLTTKQNFYSLFVRLELEYNKIINYKEQVTDPTLLVSSNIWNKIETLKADIIKLQTDANQLCEKFEEEYQKIYTESLSLCSENNEDIGELTLKIKRYEQHYQDYYIEAHKGCESLTEYRNLIESRLEAQNKEKTSKQSVQAQQSFLTQSQKSVNKQPCLNLNIDSTFKENQVKAQERREKRDAWLKAQKEFSERQKAIHAANRNRKELDKDFREELAFRSVVSNATTLHSFKQKPAPTRNLSQWQTHELLRVEDERTTLEKAYLYIQSVTDTHSTKKQTTEDQWVIRQALIGILGRFMEVLQFIGPRSEEENDNISLKEAARRIRNQLLKEGKVEIDLTVSTDEILTIVKKLVDFFKAKKLTEFPTHWRAFKEQMASPLLEKLVEHTSPLPTIMTLETCKSKVDLIQKDLARLSNYRGPYNARSLFDIVELFLKAKWGTISAYIRKRPDVMINSTVDYLTCQSIMRPEYIALGNRFRHAEEPLLFSSSTKAETIKMANTVTVMPTTIMSTMAETVSTYTSAAATVDALDDLLTSSTGTAATTSVATTTPTIDEASVESFISKLILDID